MITEKISIRTSRKTDFLDITHNLREFINKNRIKDGKLTVFIPHTTAAVTINENADPDVLHDLKFALDKIAPDMPGFRHMEGNSSAHLRSSLFGCSQDILVQKGKLLLGTWQGVYFCEFDGPRTRSFILAI